MHARLVALAANRVEHPVGQSIERVKQHRAHSICSGQQIGLRAGFRLRSLEISLRLRRAQRLALGLKIGERGHQRSRRHSLARFPSESQTGGGVLRVMPSPVL